jgi:2-oxoglutarate ferredoxin oxidoreductase subunit beta
MVYVVMNNGCYGLTKGQDSATADNGSKNKHGHVNPFEGIDLAGLALELGATFVAQSFSGDKAQLVPLMKAAMKHPGFAFINVISPCVTFNNNVGSTKSYDYVREHVEATSTIDFVPEMKEIKTAYAEGEKQKVKMHDGSYIQLNKLEKDWDPLSHRSATDALLNAKAKGEILTGLIYMNPNTTDLHHTLNTSARPLNTLKKQDLCPGSKALAEINKELR